LNSYQELTQKLESALNKISFSKKGLNKTVSQTDTFYKRSEECAERRKKEIEKKQEEKER